MRHILVRMFASLVSTLVVLSGIMVLMNTPTSSANAQPYPPISYWQEPVA